MQKLKITETLLLFGSLAFLVMWVDQFFYKGVTLKDSYFFLMYAVAGFLFYVYRRGVRKMNEQKDNPTVKKSSKNKR